MLKRNETLIKKKLWQYLIPSIMTNMAMQIGNVVDTILVGNILGKEAMSSVQIGSTVLLLIQIPEDGGKFVERYLHYGNIFYCQRIVFDFLSGSDVDDNISVPEICNSLNLLYRLFRLSAYISDVCTDSSGHSLFKNFEIEIFFLLQNCGKSGMDIRLFGDHAAVFRHGFGNLICSDQAAFINNVLLV